MGYQKIQVPATGDKITVNADTSLNVPNNPIIPFIEGDGIGPEIMAEASRVLDRVNVQFSLGLNTEHCLIGGAAIDATGEPLPDETLAKAKQSDAVLLGAVGGPKWDALPMDKRPEKGLLKIRAGMDLFANLRPALLYPELASASTLKEEVVGTVII